MPTEVYVEKAKEFLRDKFGSTQNVKSGLYAVPVATSKGTAYMKLEVTPEMEMKDFRLYKDSDLTQIWIWDNDLLILEMKHFKKHQSK